VAKAMLPREAAEMWLELLADPECQAPPPTSATVLDPVAWMEERLGAFLWSVQRDIAAAVAAHRRVAVHSCWASGKSWLAARLVAWWLDTHPPGEAFVVTTATTGAQVRAILWREIGRAHRDGKLAGRLNQTEWWLGGEMVAIGRKPADYDATAFQGIHARYVLVVIDEAAGVPEAIFRAAAGITSNVHSRVLAIGNPDDAQSYFARVCAPGSGWEVRGVDAFATPNFTGEPVPDALRDQLISRDYEQELRAEVGADSPVYVAKVRGRFPVDAPDGVIPASWIVAAQRRWQDWQARGEPPPAFTCVGVDVGAGGDPSVLAPRHGPLITELQRLGTKDTMATTGAVAALLQTLGGYAYVDEIGIGAGVGDRLREQGLPGEAFIASAASPFMDPSGKLGFVNRRAEAWWNLRVLLDPQHGNAVALPPDDRLAADLAAPRYQFVSGGQIRIESKADIRKRLGRSTNDGDAVVQAFAARLPDTTPRVVVDTTSVQISPY
jgi:hypothetical protein